MPENGPPSRAPVATVRGVLAFWAAVVALLVGLDVVLFDRGVLWTRTPYLGSGWQAVNWALTYGAIRNVEAARTRPETAFVIGSSVVYAGVDEEVTNAALAGEGVPARVARLTTFGGSATDSTLLAWYALRAHPWLVIYEAAPRDFLRTAGTDSTVARIFYDASIELPALPRTSVAEHVDAWVKRLWPLYRYRFFVRAVLEQTARDAIATPLVASPAHAAEPPVVEPPFRPGEVKPENLKHWLRWKETRAFADYKVWLEAQSPGLLDVYRNMTLTTYGPDDNLQVESLARMLAATTRAGTRMVLLYGPENPVFRAPEAAPYFDRALSDTYARVFADQAERVGARFIDLRDALTADDFGDLVHVNRDGARKLSTGLAEIVREEWVARGE